MDEEIEGTDVAVGAVGSEGERRSSTLSPARDDESVAPLAPGQRWSLTRKRDVVLRLMQGEPVEALSRRLGLPVYKLEEWRQRGLAGIDAGLRDRDSDPRAQALAEAHRRMGELNRENELLRTRLEKPGPLVRRRSR
jgi:transposase